MGISKFMLITLQFAASLASNWSTWFCYINIIAYAILNMSDQILDLSCSINDMIGW